MRYSDSDIDQPSDDSDASEAPMRRSKGSAKSGRARGPKLRTLNRWTPEEHDRLAYLVNKWGSEKNWAKVAEEMPGRTGKQCRERWLNHMKPGIIKGNWSFEEEFLLAQCHAVVGSHWSKMTKRLPGRTENSIKNFWNATLRSKAPHKRRGVLWLYMQQQTCQEGENVDAFLNAVARLYDTQELPASWAQLMDEGRLTERTLRAVLRAEKDFLENADTELHPLALPHPNHAGLTAMVQGPLGAALTAEPAAAAAAAEVVAAAEADAAGAGAGTASARQNPPAAAEGASAADPTSPGVPGPGLTPRFPGVEGSTGQRSGLPCPAAFDASAVLGGLALPPEVLAALGPQEVWSGMPSSQAPAGPFGAAPGSMEPLMGLASDMHPSGHQPGGAFGGNMGGSILAAGQDNIWSCLPSLTGLCNTLGGGLAAPGGYTPHGADALKLLEPYGALHGHRSSSNSIQTRPGSALEYDPPQTQHAAAGSESQGLSRRSSSRPGSSIGMTMSLLAPRSASPAHGLASSCYSQQAGGNATAAAAADRATQQQQLSSSSMPEEGFKQEDSGHQGQHQAAAAAARGPTSQPQHSWYSQGMADASMQAAAAAGYGGLHSWGTFYQQQGVRGSSPTDSGSHSELAATTAAYQSAGHGPACNCTVCAVRYAQTAAGSRQAPGNSGWAQTYSTGVQQQQQNEGQLCNQDYPHLQAAWAGSAHQQQQRHQQQQLSVSSAPLSDNSRLQAQHSGVNSPFASHADQGWESGSAAQASTAAAAAAAAGTAAKQPVPGWGSHTSQSTEAPQQAKRSSWQGLQLEPPLPGAGAASLFSPHSVDSPLTGALQHLMDSAAAVQAGVCAQGICGWLASSTAHAGGSSAHAAAEADCGPDQQQQRRQERTDRARVKGWACMDPSDLPDLQQRQTDRLPAPPPLLQDSGAHSTAHAGAHDANFASILEVLLGPRHSAQLGDMLMSPAGLSSTAALLHGGLCSPGAAGNGREMAAGGGVLGVKRERSLPDAQEDLLIEQPGIKLPRVF